MNIFWVPLLSVVYQLVARTRSIGRSRSRNRGRGRGRGRCRGRGRGRGSGNGSASDSASGSGRGGGRGRGRVRTRPIGSDNSQTLLPGVSFCTSYSLAIYVQQRMGYLRLLPLCDFQEAHFPRIFIWETATKRLKVSIVAQVGWPFFCWVWMLRWTHRKAKSTGKSQSRKWYNGKTVQCY